MNRLLFGAALAISLSGCMRYPLEDSPLLARGSTFDTSNQILLTPPSTGPEAYADLFELVLDVVDDTFEIAYANRYDGRIETQPRISPGLEQIFKPGSPNFRERVQATFQTIRHRGFVFVQPEREGYVVSVMIYRELEDLPNPSRDAGGGAAFRSDNPVDRTYEVVDPTVVSTLWIPNGRDYPLEQKILNRIRLKMNPGPGR